MVIAPSRPRIEPEAPRPPRKTGTTTASKAILVGIGALGLAALLNADALERTARSQPFGWKRSALVALVRPVVETSHFLRLDRPRRWIDEAIHGGPSPLPVAPTPTPTPSVPTPTPSPVPPIRRTPTAAAPLRIWVGGDSMIQVPGGSLSRLAAGTDRARVRVEVRYSTGLTRPDFYDWPGRLRTLVSGSRPPEALVVMFGANDAQGIRTANGAEPFGSKAWKAEYRARVAATMRLLAGEARTVYWIGQPIMRSRDLSQRMRILNEIYRSEAARNGIRFIETWHLFADENGRYAAALPAGGGRPVLMRQADGIHLTRAGGDRLARAILAAIGADWELNAR